MNTIVLETTVKEIKKRKDRAVLFCEHETKINVWDGSENKQVMKKIKNLVLIESSNFFWKSLDKIEKGMEIRFGGYVDGCYVIPNHIEWKGDRK